MPSLQKSKGEMTFFCILFATKPALLASLNFLHSVIQMVAKPLSLLVTFTSTW